MPSQEEDDESAKGVDEGVEFEQSDTYVLTEPIKVLQTEPNCLGDCNYLCESVCFALISNLLSRYIRDEMFTEICQEIHTISIKFDTSVPIGIYLWL
jgi:hypothetical protein